MLKHEHDGARHFGRARIDLAFFQQRRGERPAALEHHFKLTAYLRVDSTRTGASKLYDEFLIQLKKVFAIMYPSAQRERHLAFAEALTFSKPRPQLWHRACQRCRSVQHNVPSQ